KKRKGFYPGSALIAASLLSPKDKLIACDMHKGEVEHLKRALQKFAQARVLKESGYDILTREIPPPPGCAGGVLIDPSYEVKTEYGQVAEAVVEAHNRWTAGVFLIWYPILKAGNHKDMVATLSALPKAQVDEVLFRDPASEGKGMAGSGMIVIGA
ncbi:MAG TPA: 23S rRNA (adenine(2030)-N(6))-methyltransferase RlmJ, partial [Alphaproteobacteria bacterium]|nr:23S rRNA (adenine(2030)-N(6))-methyltransferase RlmJ [Alphaproteobacteria bacterium]